MEEDPATPPTAGAAGWVGLPAAAAMAVVEAEAGGGGATATCWGGTPPHRCSKEGKEEEDLATATAEAEAGEGRATATC